MESEERRRPIGEAVALAGVLGTTVGICENELMGWPHDAQNRLSAETFAEHDGH